MKTTPSPLPSPPLPPPKLISLAFKAYDKSIRDVWESYQFHSFYFPVLHQLVKAQKVPPFQLPSLGAASGSKIQHRKHTLGAISHILRKVSPQRSLISAVAHTESFLQYLVIRVLRDFPQRLLSGTQPEQGAREGKLLDIIINSNDKWEMLDKIIEEKVRALFYGSPADFFLKDKARLGFKDYFVSNCAPEINNYVEITARRNVLMHSDGRIDRKYLREVPQSPFSLGAKITLDSKYMRESLITLRGLCATSGVLVCERVYNNKVPSGVMLERKRVFSL